jgi:predicted metal-binding protein
MPKPIAYRRTACTAIVLTCGKCARKLDGGYGHEGEQSFRAALRGAIRTLVPRPKIQLIETRCLGLCPKKAVVAINASEPGRLLTIPKGTDPAAALSALLKPDSGESRRRD